jgi:hypothetical protein
VGAPDFNLVFNHFGALRPGGLILHLSVRRKRQSRDLHEWEWHHAIRSVPGQQVPGFAGTKLIVMLLRTILSRRRQP